MLALPAPGERAPHGASEPQNDTSSRNNDGSSRSTPSTKPSSAASSQIVMSRSIPTGPLLRNAAQQAASVLQERREGVLVGGDDRAADSGFDWANSSYDRNSRGIRIWLYAIDLRVSLALLDKKWSYLLGAWSTQACACSASAPPQPHLSCANQTVPILIMPHVRHSSTALPGPAACMSPFALARCSARALAHTLTPTPGLLRNSPARSYVDVRVHCCALPHVNPSTPSTHVTSTAQVLILPLPAQTISLAVVPILLRPWPQTARSRAGGYSEEARSARARLLAVRLRSTILQLGPTFIKIGQLFSSRSDFLGKEFVEELSKLQDRVPSFSAEKTLETLEQQLGAPVTTCAPGSGL